MSAQPPTEASEPAHTDIKIRTAHRTEAGAIAELTHRAFAQQARLYDDHTLPPLADTAESVAAEMARGAVVLVAEDAATGAIVGAVRGEMREQTCHVGRLVVDPAWQGRGVGRELAVALEGRFPRAQRFSIFTGHRSEAALHLYESLGYEREREQPVHDRLRLVFLGKERDAAQ